MLAESSRFVVRARRAISTVIAVMMAAVVLPLQEAGAGGDGSKEARAPASVLADVDRSSSELRGAIERYETDLGAIRRTFDMPMSPQARRRRERFIRRWLEAIETIDFDSLGRDGKVDWLLFRGELEHELRLLGHRARQDAEVEPLLPFWRTIVDLEAARRRLEPVDARAAATALAGLIPRIETLRRRIEHGGTEKDGQDADASGAAVAVPRRPAVANRAADRVLDLHRALEHWYRFYDGYDPLFTWWVKEPYGRVSRALEKYARFLRERLAGRKEGDDDAIIGDPIGRDALLDELRHEMIPYTPEELIEIARKQFAWCDAEMLRASRELGFGDDWRRAQEHVKDLHVPPGEQPILIRDLAREAIDFIEKRDLVTIPPLARETWRMEMMSPERQRMNPYFTGGEVISVSYPTAEMAHEDKLMSLRGNNIHFSRATVHHELIPGHHLQQFMRARYRVHRRLFGTPFWVEGWALYWEMLLWDLGFPRSPEDRIGMLFWRKHRCARIIFSLNFHLEKMTAQEAIDFLVERVGHERRNATAEVRRSVSGGYSPLYQCAYMIGGLQIRALHRELVGGGVMSEREFHDSVLQQNAIPIEMVRAALTGEGLRRDFEPAWRFADER